MACGCTTGTTSSAELRRSGCEMGFKGVEMFSLNVPYARPEVGEGDPLSSEECASPTTVADTGLGGWYPGAPSPMGFSPAVSF